MAYTEKVHASSCGLMFRPDHRCTCAVGEVERLKKLIREFVRMAADSPGSICPDCWHLFHSEPSRKCTVKDCPCTG
jgi:hypothetical protein